MHVHSLAQGVFFEAAQGPFALSIPAHRGTMARPVLLPLSLCVAVVMLLKSSTFVQAPARTVDGPQQQLRVMETAALSTGIAMTNALPAMATWSEGSEPGQNIDPDSTEAYNRKILNATAICSQAALEDIFHLLLWLTLNLLQPGFAWMAG